MIKVLFICHGNICRSTMAQFVFQDIVNKLGISEKFYIYSKATSSEELGNGPHIGTIRKLKKVGVPILEHRSQQVSRIDYDYYDYIIGMDNYNYRNLIRMLGEDKDKKISLLLDYTSRKGEINDPWYTGDFDETYSDICEGLDGFLKHLKENNKI